MAKLMRDRRFIFIKWFGVLLGYTMPRAARGKGVAFEFFKQF
jgi:hypothetical protein